MSNGHKRNGNLKGFIDILKSIYTKLNCCMLESYPYKFMLTRGSISYQGMKCEKNYFGRKSYLIRNQLNSLSYKSQLPLTAALFCFFRFLPNGMKFYGALKRPHSTAPFDIFHPQTLHTTQFHILCSFYSSHV